MKLYGQLTPPNDTPREIPNENTHWDANNFCTPEKLIADGRAEMFKVFEIQPSEKPTCDPLTEKVVVAQPALVDGQWVRQWSIEPMTEEEREQAAAKRRLELKAQREAAVAAIKVTTAAGNTFDGDETSQTRMARAILRMQAAGAPSVTWVLADNTVIQATAAELTEALALAAAAQAAIWVIT
jgi:hypothetical protein